MLKKSKYNIFTDFDGENKILYNSFSGTLALFDKASISKYAADAFSQEEFEILKQKGVYVDWDFDEDAEMLEERKRVSYESKEMYIRLWTTSACNANCFYCFEKGYPTQTMTRETADKLIAYIKKQYRGEKAITFEWFGGEPLMNVGIIDYLFDQLSPFCEENNCKFKSFFITNGSLITDEIIEKMIRWNTFNVQITLDGDKPEYEAIKAYNNAGKYTFERMMGIIQKLTKYMRVSVRMNYTGRNYESLSALIDKLIGLKNENLSAYVYPLWNSLNEQGEKYISDVKADENIIYLMDKLVDAGLADITIISRLSKKRGSCTSSCDNSFAVYPDGALGKCSETYRQKLGDLDAGIVEKDLFDFWTSPELPENCAGCKLIPICQGGCKSSHFTDMPQCHPYKDILPEVLRWYGGRKLRSLGTTQKNNGEDAYVC